MDVLYAVLLGIIQGLTEFLPISSTGHLILAERFLQLDPTVFGLTFDVALHIGTAAAVIIYFWQTWIRLFVGSFEKGESGVQNVDRRILLAVLVGTIPAGLFGLLFEDAISSTFRSPLVIAAALLFGSVLFYIAERTNNGSLLSPSGRNKERKTVEQTSVLDGFWVGCSQAVALIPGISRSGITISAGLLRGFNRESAARFAFLLSTPIIAGAGAKKLADILLHDTVVNWPLFTVGAVTAFITGFITIVYFLRFLKTHSLSAFIWYRVVLAIIVLVLYFARILQ